MINFELWKKDIATKGFRKELVNAIFSGSDKKVNLHLHTDITDGILSPENLVLEAKKAKMDMIAITDHDTIKTALVASEPGFNNHGYEGTILSGAEIGVVLNGRRLEVVLLDFDTKKANELVQSGEFPFLNRSFKHKRFIYNIMKRIESVNNHQLTEKPLTISDFVKLETIDEKGEIVFKPFSELNINALDFIDFDADVLPEQIMINGSFHKVSYESFNFRLFKLLEKSPKAMAVINSFTNDDGLPVTNFADFNRFVLQSDGNIFSVDDKHLWPSIKDVKNFADKIKIDDKKVVVSLAHPFGYSTSQGLPHEFIPEAVNEGINALECMHGFNTAEEIEFLSELAYKYELLPTIGNDWHGYPQSRQHYKFGIDTLPGYEGSFEKTNIFHNVPLTTENFYLLATGQAELLMGENKSFS